MKDQKLPSSESAPVSASETFVPLATPQRLPGATDDASIIDRPAMTDAPAEGPADVHADSLTTEAIAEYRARLARGYYGTPLVMRALAERLLESGDL